VLVITPDDRLRYAEYNPSINAESPVQTHTDDPTERLQNMLAADAVILPDYTIGGMFGSGTRNGFSTGIKSIRRKFTGIVAAFPAITNTVSGNVGANNRKNRLREGAKAQLTMYTQDNQAYLSTYVGTLTPEVVVSP
jgi:hypothetical protein